MIPSLLFFLYDALGMKNICHTYSIENFGCVVQVPLLADFCYFCEREKFV
jgi:hypothetical protein